MFLNTGRGVLLPLDIFQVSHEVFGTYKRIREGTDVSGSCCHTWPRGYKTFFMLSSAETKIYPAHKC